MGMLVLTRRKNEVVRIGDDVRVMIVESAGGQVKLGIEAPKSMTITREDSRDDAGYEKAETRR